MASARAAVRRHPVGHGEGPEQRLRRRCTTACSPIMRCRSRWREARDKFFAGFASSATDAKVKRAAREMAAEEAEHVRLIEDWLKRVPDPRTGKRTPTRRSFGLNQGPRFVMNLKEPRQSSSEGLGGTGRLLERHRRDARPHRVRCRAGRMGRAAEVPVRRNRAAVRAGAEERPGGAGRSGRAARAHLPHDRVLLRQAGLPGGAPGTGEDVARYMGRHYPAMSMIFVADLLDDPGKIELEATAVVPAAPVRRAAKRKAGSARPRAKRATTRRRRAAFLSALRTFPNARPALPSSPGTRRCRSRPGSTGSPARARACR